MANQSTLRPALSSLLQQYLELLRKAPKYSRVLLAAVLAAAAGGYYQKRRLARKRAEERQGRALIRRNSEVKLNDGVRVIYVPYKTKNAKVTIRPTKATTFDAHRRLFLEPPGGRDFRRASGSGGGEGPPINTKPGLNLAFLHQLLSLLSIMIPRLTSKESFLLLLHTIFLVSRTYLSLVVARLDGEIVRDLVAGNGKAFSWGIVKWLGVGGPAVYCNAMIKYLQAKISIAFRTRLTRYIHDLYLNDNLGYYKVQNLDGGLVGGGADQFITSDLPLFCDNAAALYSSLGKPFLDLVVFNYQLYRALGGLSFAGIMVNYIGSAWMLRKLSPPFGKLAAAQGRREGEFRGLHSRIIANAEEIAFYGGADMEQGFLDQGFRELKHLMERIYGMKIRYNMLEDFVLKYSWSALGYLFSSMPVFLPAWGGLGGLVELGSPTSGGKEKDRMRAFITNKRLMLSLADAGGRMMYSIKDLSELAGYTSRVYSLVSTLHRVHSHSYSSPRPELFSLADIQGTLHYGFTGIRLEGVPIVVPSVWPHGGEILVDDVDILIRPGDHLLISGPNGAGKTSVARLIAGLWPVYRGLISRPRNVSNAGLKEDPVTADLGGIMFLPQKPYLAQGTLRDQVIYPHTEADMRAAGVSDWDLIPVLKAVRLSYLPDREGGWDTKKEWKDVLSGGEKQRISLARVIYHSPAFAVLDEPTSAVSSDVEGVLYSVCKEKGITLVTLSTRASLKKYHTFQLSLDGEGGWAMERIGGQQERGEVERELEMLRERVKDAKAMRERLEKVKAALAKVWVEGGELPDEEVFIGTESYAESVTPDFAYSILSEAKAAEVREGEASAATQHQEETTPESVETAPSEMSASFADVTKSQALAESQGDVSAMGESYADIAEPASPEVKDGESYDAAITTEKDLGGN
ncbi:ABC transporter transmembrane region 2-domain-containing protein [Sphaerosporella brunnea]|uniref:ABC transporter transmembrane region 2-domain-containing protein n=1 Tax=Sphaerosporella brunnea TaxID=1250544 RepID=A0A5J5EXN3_9PEZI|nr:ABC transporter transmembrane region 2-domain-containing protein [Sphaerosporella brunnea]